MSNNETIVPVHHSALSGLGSTVAGTAVGAAKSGIMGFLITAGVGLAVAVGGIALSFSALPIAAALITSVASVGMGVGVTALGGGVATISGIFGGFNGGARAAGRVRQEQGAANALDTQLALFQAQQVAVAQQPVTYQQPNPGFPVQGAPMNPAQKTILAASAANDGPITGRQLQRA